MPAGSHPAPSVNLAPQLFRDPGQREMLLIRDRRARADVPTLAPESEQSPQTCLIAQANLVSALRSPRQTLKALPVEATGRLVSSRMHVPAQYKSRGWGMVMHVPQGVG